MKIEKKQVSQNVVFHYYRNKRNQIVVLICEDNGKIEVRTASFPYGEVSIFPFSNMEDAKVKAGEIYNQYSAVYGEI